LRLPTRIRHVRTDEDERRVALLHRNLRTHGTVHTSGTIVYR